MKIPGTYGGGVPLAGRYMGDVIKKAALNPYISALGVGGLAAGGATLGNLISGEAAQEGPGRLGLEALGAGALGAAVGARIPGSLAQMGRARRAMAQELGAQGAGRVRVQFDPATGQAHPVIDANPLRNELRQTARDISKGANLGNNVGTALSTLGAGALGGMLGGGVANVGKFVGIPGLTQDRAMQMAAQQAIDPEDPLGSSNTMQARHSVTTRQYGV